MAIVGAVVGALWTWTSDDAVRLDGTQGPNNGWLVLIFAAFAIGWTRSMLRGTWVGVAGVLGSAIVMGSTAVESWLDSRDVLGASPSLGLLLVVAASVALAGAAVARGLQLTDRSLRGEAQAGR